MNITMYEKNTKYIHVTVEDVTDLAGASFLFRMGDLEKTDMTSNGNVATIKIEPKEAKKGIYSYLLKVTLNNDVSTVVSGRINII